jgi:hypothetical protein
MLENLRAGLPDAATIRADLAAVPPVPFDYAAMEKPWQGYTLHHYSVKQIMEFDGYAWSRATALNWQYPLAAVACYVLMIPALKLKKDAVDVGGFARWWNFGLAIFSFAGFCATAPVLLGELYANGFYFTTCAPAPWYGGGQHGLFVALFIYSKFAELVFRAASKNASFAAPASSRGRRRRSGRRGKRRRRATFGPVGRSTRR